MLNAELSRSRSSARSALPDAVQARTMLSAGIAAKAADPEDAAALISSLTAPDARTVAAAKGVEPAVADITTC